MNKVNNILSVLCILYAILFTSCNPEAHWETKNVQIAINPYTVSAGYIECSFTPDKDTYYLVACEPARVGYDPTAPENQKQFMTLALDSANVDYITWRYDLLTSGEFNIAPFASHELQYGAIDKFFTNLVPGTDYWVYAFVVDPDKMKPVGKLFLEHITTTAESVVNVHFDYRVRGYWDYIYPINESDGKINNHFPYLAATRDSAVLADYSGQSPEDYFSDLFENIAIYNLTENVRYGVNVVLNDGLASDEAFQEGHTYYTAIVSFDGFMGNNVIYKFTWTGEDFEAYFTDEDSIADDGEDE